MLFVYIAVAYAKVCAHLSSAIIHHALAALTALLLLNYHNSFYPFKSIAFSKLLVIAWTIYELIILASRVSLLNKATAIVLLLVLLLELLRHTACLLVRWHKWLCLQVVWLRVQEWAHIRLQTNSKSIEDSAYLVTIIDIFIMLHSFNHFLKLFAFYC